MDLESEPSVENYASVETEVVEKNGEIDVKVNDNGNCDPENVGDKLVDEVKVEETIEKKESSPSPATKGRGLKKWRRIRRESGKESNSNLDSNRKRGMTALPIGMKLRSEGSSSSTNAMSNVLGNAFDHSPLDFASRADSENSEDRNSRSSTAASAPRVNHELPFGLGLDMNTMRNLKGMNSGVSVQPGDQQEKSRNVTKKARGGKLKKEKSYSSMESDSRSSNFMFAQGANSITSNGGRQSGRSGNYDEEFSDDARNGDRNLHEESQTAFSKNEADSEDVSREDLAVESEKVDDHVGSGDRDSLVECIMPLHLAQEALEKEIEKLKNVGKEDTLSSSDDSSQPSKSTLVNEDFQSAKNINVNLQNKLEESRVLLELKDAKISKLESTLNFEDIRIEHEELLTQRIAAELEYLVIIKTIENLKINKINILQEKKLIESEKVQVEDALKLRKGVYKYASCLTIQLVLIFVAVYLLVLKFSSQNVEVIPT